MLYELIFTVEEVVLTVSEVKVLYKVTAAVCIRPSAPPPPIRSSRSEQSPLHPFAKQHHRRHLHPNTSHRSSTLAYYNNKKMSLNKVVSDLCDPPAAEKHKTKLPFFCGFLSGGPEPESSQPAAGRTSKRMNHKSEPTHSKQTCGDSHTRCFIGNNSILIR